MELDEEYVQRYENQRGEFDIFNEYNDHHFLITALYKDCY